MGITDPSMATPEQTLAVAQKSRDKYEVIMYLCGLNQNRFQGLIDNLNNSFLQGRDKYPQSLTEAYKLSTNWRETPRQRAIDKGDAINFLQDADSNDECNDDHADIALTTKGKEVRHKNGTLIKCDVCGGNHWINQCPKVKSLIQAEREKFKAKNDDEELVEGIQQATIGEWEKDISCFAGLGFFQLHEEITVNCTEPQNDPLCVTDSPSEAHFKHILQQSGNKLINKWWILLDSCSTVNIFCNPRLLSP